MESEHKATNKMAIDLYYTAGSPPCRLVLLVAAALDVHLNLKVLDLGSGEHLKDDFLKLNPQHTVPTMVDEGFSLWESRAISRYLINKFDPDSSLYPKDLKTRALVDQRLDFDLGTLYPRFAQYYYPQLFGGVPRDEEAFKKIEEALGFFNTFLEGSNYAVGSELTLADLSLVASVSTFEAAEIDLKPYKNIDRWLKLVKTTARGYGDTNERGLEEFKKMIAHMKGDRSEL